MTTTKYVPLLSNKCARSFLALVLLILSAFAATAIVEGGQAARNLLVLVLAWLPAMVLTDKYVHKYPHRYDTYLVASHFKAATVMMFLLALLALIIRFDASSWAGLVAAFAIFVLADLAASLPRRALGRAPATHAAKAADSGSKESAAALQEETVPIDSNRVLSGLRSAADATLLRFVEQNLPESEGKVGEVLVCDPGSLGAAPTGPVGLVAAGVRMNDVRRINRFLLDCTSRLAMGGYFVCRYTPYERSLNELKRRYPGALCSPAYLLHFARYRALPKIPYLNALYFAFTGGKGRVFSKVELWGRLSYCGMHVVAETGDDNERFLIARKTALPSRNPRPSYYPVVALEKVGLDGEIVRLHKVRSMYPFSEFLQKRIFEDNGLASTGKFANDFRLTEYGNFIRKYWIDELPQIWDWLRGDIKLVGMRATSRHYLSLYPQELYDLYIQIKPGLIPPIFDEKTDSFDKIVEVEMAYLTSYMKSPLRTDVELFFKTFTDIFFRGVRSK